MCYALIFLALVNQLDAPRMYQNGYFNTVEECESTMVQQSKKLFPNDEFIFKDTSNGLMGFFNDQRGDQTFYQCINAFIDHKIVCEKSLLGSYDNCDCGKLLHDSNPLKQLK